MKKKNILKLLQEIKRNLKEFKYEVIFVDDNSEDGSIEILKKIKFIDKRFDYVLHDGPRDLTQSCFQGISTAKNNLIVIMDGDLQHNPTYIKPLFYKLVQDKADLVIGSRDFENIKKNSLSFVRLTFSKILIITLKILSGKKYLDPMSGFFLFKKKNFYKK